MDELIAFLNRMIDADEAMARAASDPPWQVEDSGYGDHVALRDAHGDRLISSYDEADLRSVDGHHIARHDPARVLADVAAKRAIIAAHHPIDPCDAHDSMCRTIPCDTLLALALPYADHADYRAEWRP